MRIMYGKRQTIGQNKGLKRIVCISYPYLMQMNFRLENKDEQNGVQMMMNSRAPERQKVPVLRLYPADILVPFARFLFMNVTMQ